MTDDRVEWRKARDLIATYAGRRVPAADVDDVTADILLQLVRYRGRFQQAANPVAWLRRVAASRIAEYYRQRSVSAAAMAPPDFQDGEPETETDLAACLTPLISVLKPIYREALILVDFQGQRIADAARSAGVSLPAMKARLRRARQQLRAELLACCRVELDRRGGVVDYHPRRSAPAETSCGC